MERVGAHLVNNSFLFLATLLDLETGRFCLTSAILPEGQGKKTCVLMLSRSEATSIRYIQSFKVCVNALNSFCTSPPSFQSVRENLLSVVLFAAPSV